MSNGNMVSRVESWNTDGIFNGSITAMASEEDEPVTRGQFLYSGSVTEDEDDDALAIANNQRFPTSEEESVTRDQFLYSGSVTEDEDDDALAIANNHRLPTSEEDKPVTPFLYSGSVTEDEDEDDDTLAIANNQHLPTTEDSDVESVIYLYTMYNSDKR